MPKEASLLTTKVEEWGKTKFKPTLKEATRTSQNPFSKARNFHSTGDGEIGNINRGGFKGRNSSGGMFRGNNRGRGGRFNGMNNKPFNQNNGGAGKYQRHKDDRVRFNPIARDAKPDVGTPWTKFKDEINHKKREETQAASQANMDTEEAKNVLKQREMNYRRLLMEQKKHETTQWEDFGESDQCEGGNRKPKKSKHPTVMDQLKTSSENMGSNMKTKEKCKARTIIKKNKAAPSVQELETKHVGHKIDEENNKSMTIHPQKPSEGMSQETKTEEENITNTKKKNKNKQLPSQKGMQRNTNVTEVRNYESNENKIKRKGTQLENKDTPENKDGRSRRKKLKKMHSLQINNETLSTENGGNYDKSSKEHSKDSKPLVSNDDLKNFNASSLSFHQKDALRRIITKGVAFKTGTSLGQCLKNRKYQVACKEKRNKNTKQ